MKKEKASKLKAERAAKKAEKLAKKEKSAKQRKRRESKQKEIESKERSAKAAKEARNKKAERYAKAVRERKAKAKRAEKAKKEEASKARERRTKEKKAKRVAAEKKKKERLEKAKIEKLDKAKVERAAKEKRAKKEAELKEKAVLAEKAEKEAAAKAAEKADKEKLKEQKEKARLKELAEKKAKEQKEKVAEKADKAEKKAKETAKKKAIAAERERKAQCSKKKAARERQIKSQYPKKINVSYRGGWKFYGDPYAPLAAYAKGNICQLEGRLRRTTSCSSNCAVAKLNDHQCRPSKTLHFAANHKDKQVAISITKDGFVRIGDFQPDWISLSGIVWTRDNYMIESTSLLELGEGAGASSQLGQRRRRSRRSKQQLDGSIKASNGWSISRAAVARKFGNMCILSGELRGTSWLSSGHRFVGQLPNNCRPFTRMMFSTQAKPEGSPLRVDLLPDGKIEVVGVESRPISPAVYLDGITFSTVQGKELKLSEGFKWFGGEYQKPQARVENGICHVQGVVTGSVQPSKITVLPEWCRPEKTLTFNAPYTTTVQQIDVHPSGQVWVKTKQAKDERVKQQYVSLSDVTFPIPYESAYGEIMNTPCK